MPRLAKCKVCRQEYEKRQMGQVVCSVPCATTYAITKRERAAAKREQEERQVIRDKRAKLKSRAAHLREAQTVVNAYVRERDSNLPCISCGTWTASAWHAGHYRSIGAAPNLRFAADTNIHKQCAKCNTHLSGNQIEYRIGLVGRIGLHAVERIERENNPKHYTIDDAIQIKAEYRLKLKELRARHDHC